MKMEDMHLSGPDNTKLEVRLCLLLDRLPVPDFQPVCVCVTCVGVCHLCVCPGLGP